MGDPCSASRKQATTSVVACFLPSISACPSLMMFKPHTALVPAWRPHQKIGHIVTSIVRFITTVDVCRMTPGEDNEEDGGDDIATRRRGKRRETMMTQPVEHDWPMTVSRK